MTPRSRFAVVAVLALAACASDNASPSSSSSSSPLPSRTNASITLAGDSDIVNAFEQPDVRCQFPDVGGTSIALLSSPQGFAFRIRVQRDKVTVLVTAGAGERDFTGPGVTEFDASRGAKIDSPLTEVPTASGQTGQIGTLTSIKGEVDCGGQQPGTSTLSLTGLQLDDVRVECNNAGAEVVVVGVADVDGVRTFIDLGLRLDGVYLRELGPPAHTYIAPAGSVTLGTNGAHVAGDAIEQDATPPRTVHMEGDVVCGTPVS